jgi:hypothetical protein
MKKINCSFMMSQIFSSDNVLNLKTDKKKHWKAFKTWILIMNIFLINNFHARSQITFEKSYLTSNVGQLGEEFFLTNLGNDEYKYAIYNYRNSIFSLYNLDHTPYLMNVSIPVSNDSAASLFFRLGYITTTLFDCDSTNIEYAMMLDNPRADRSPNFAVYRTDGTVLFSKDTVGTFFCIGCGSGSWEMHPIMNTPAGTKIFLFNNEVPGFQKALIYAVCGKLPDAINEIKNNSNYITTFPNPSSSQVTFKIRPPSHIEKYRFNIFNSAFQIIKTIEINGETYYTYDIQALSSGTYFYSLQGDQKIFQTGNFIITQ